MGIKKDLKQKEEVIARLQNMVKEKAKEVSDQKEVNRIEREAFELQLAAITHAAGGELLVLDSTVTKRHKITMQRVNGGFLIKEVKKDVPTT